MESYSPRSLLPLYSVCLSWRHLRLHHRDPPWSSSSNLEPSTPTSPRALFSSSFTHSHSCYKTSRHLCSRYLVAFLLHRSKRQANEFTLVRFKPTERSIDLHFQATALQTTVLILVLQFLSPSPVHSERSRLCV